MSNVLQPTLIARLAIVSDIHAYQSKDKAHQSNVNLSPGAVGSNPLDDLLAELKSQRTRADVLICAGDICNQADYGGLKAAWSRLNSINLELQGEMLVSTCGNHDLDSRYLAGEPDPDPKGGLLALDPPFPFSDETLTNKFWARNFVILKLKNDLVVVTLNTSAYHGGHPDEMNYGRVSSRTINALASELATTSSSAAHVLVCHHHPIALTGWRPGEPDAEFIKNGQDLMDALISATGKSWLIIHGHRHKPRLLNGTSSGAMVPFVLGASSLGARIPRVPNQFHIVSLFSSTAVEHSPLVGSIETWSWTDPTRWMPLRLEEGLPPSCGFGYRGQIEALAIEVEAKDGTSFATWEEISNNCPSVNFLTPTDFAALTDALTKRGLNIVPSSDGRPKQVGR